MNKPTTGITDNLKEGIEALSGQSMEDIRVHYNSNEPTQLGTPTYAHGTAIQPAAGQEKHLPHEAWHVVQHQRGRVKPTGQLKGNIRVNDGIELETEADKMGQKAGSTTYDKE